MHRVLLVSPYFPPHTGAASHRIRLLAPHLPKFGWQPTVLTLEPSAYEERQDPGLLGLVPPDLRVIRCGAVPARLTRKVGLGDLGLRSLGPLYRTARELLRRERHDAFLITAPPHITASLGPLLKRSADVPFVLDYQDPWVGAWGATVGGGPGGSVDLRSRLSRRLGLLLEPSVLRAADGFVAVSEGTYAGTLERYPELPTPICAELPLGGEPRDFEGLDLSRHARYFDADDGAFHLCFVGTIAPLGTEVVRGLMRALALVRATRPELAVRLRAHFFGTSNRTAADAPPRVLPIARELGVADLVREVPARIDYLDALAVISRASAIVVLGSSERHYAASKLYPCLLARRPILAIYHAESLVADTLRRFTSPPTVRLVVYDGDVRAEGRAAEIAGAIEALMEDSRYDASAVDLKRSVRTAEELAGELARVLDAVAQREGRGR